jgi:hypothetical protein
MFVTETDEIWVTADFKETRLARMHRGEKVTMHVDTFGRNLSPICACGQWIATTTIDSHGIRHAVTVAAKPRRLVRSASDLKCWYEFCIYKH